VSSYKDRVQLSLVGMFVAATTGLTATRPAAAGPSARTRKMRLTATWPAHVRSAAAAVAPAVPSMAAAPAESAPESVSAPIETWTIPATVVPAIVSPAQEELDLFDVARDSGDSRAVERHCIGRYTRKCAESERKRGGVDPISHEKLHFSRQGVGHRAGRQRCLGWDRWRDVRVPNRHPGSWVPFAAANYPAKLNTTLGLSLNRACPLTPRISRWFSVDCPKRSVHAYPPVACLAGRYLGSRLR
jgi:hypothetical protein